MGIFLKNKTKGKLMLVFDIGSSSVGGALFHLGESGVPQVVFSVKEPITLEHKTDMDRLLLLMTKSLDSIAGKIHKAGFGVPSKIFCVLSSLWNVSQTRIIKLDRNTPFIFNSKLADDLIQKELSAFREENLAQQNNTSDELRPIELKNIKVMLNGYEVAKPLGKKVTSLEMTLYISMSSEKILNGVENTISKHFHFDEIKFTAFTTASFSVVRDSHAHKDNFLVIDLDGEITDISMTKKNVLRESISFPLGSNFVVRGVSSALNLSLDEAESLISSLKDGHVAEPTAKNSDPVLLKLKTEWLHGFQESLANISNDISIPATIYIIVDSDLADFFFEAIKNEQFNQYTLTESKFEIIPLDIKTLHSMAVFENNVIRYPRLVIDAIYINRFFN